MKRLFNIGTLTHVACPCPHGTLEQAIELLSMRFPQIRHTRVYERDGVFDANNDALVFTIPLIPAKTNG
jgi:hypothetical protein